MLVPLQLSGVNTDLPPWAVPPDRWTGAQGINFRDQVATRVMGSSYLYDAALYEPLHVLNSDLGGQNFWLYAGDGGIGVVDAANNHSDITPTPYSGSITPDDYTGTLLNGIPLINDSNQEPFWWNRVPGNPMTTLTGWPAGARATSMRAYKNFLLAIGYYDGSDSFPDQLVWSDAADPGLLPTEWGATATNLAGALEFGDTPGALLDGENLRGNFVLYKSGATYLLQYIGGNFVFSKRLLFNTSGVLARNCVAEVEGNHIVLTDSDVIIHDGQTAKSLVDTRTRRELFTAMDTTYYRNSFVFNFKSRDEVWVCYPENGQQYPNKALVWDKDSNKLGWRDLQGDAGGYPHIGYGNVENKGEPRQWDSQSYAWNSVDANYEWNSGLSNQVVFGGVAADPAAFGLQGVDVGESAAVGSIQGELERLSLDFGAPDRVKLVQRVWPRIDGTAGDVMQVQVGSQMDTESPVDWSATVPFTIGTDRKIDTAVQGRYLSFRFTTTDGDVYRMTGFDVELSDTTGMF